MSSFKGSNSDKDQNSKGGGGTASSSSTGNPAFRNDDRKNQQRNPRTNTRPNQNSNSNTQDHGWSRSQWGSTVKEPGQNQNEAQVQVQREGTSGPREGQNQTKNFDPRQVGERQQNHHHHHHHHTKRPIIEPKDMIKLSRDVIVSKYSKQEVPASMKEHMDFEDLKDIILSEAQEAEFANTSQMIFGDCLNESKASWQGVGPEEGKNRGPIRKDRKFGYKENIGGFRKDSSNSDKSDEYQRPEYQSFNNIRDYGSKRGNLWDDPLDEGGEDEADLWGLTLPQDKASLMVGLDPSEFSKGKKPSALEEYDVIKEIQKEDRERQALERGEKTATSEETSNERSEIDIANEQLNLLILGGGNNRKEENNTASASSGATGNAQGGMNQYQNQGYGQAAMGIGTSAGYGSSQIMPGLGNVTRGYGTAGMDVAGSGNLSAGIPNSRQSGGSAGGLGGAAPKGSGAGNAVEKKWYYKDPAGVVRGPFTTEEMNYWHRQGYFDEDLLVSCNQTSEFYPLKMYREGRVPIGQAGAAGAGGQQGMKQVGQNSGLGGPQGMHSQNQYNMQGGGNSQGMQRGNANTSGAASTGVAGSGSNANYQGGNATEEQIRYMQYQQYMAQQARETQEYQRRMQGGGGGGANQGNSQRVAGSGTGAQGNTMTAAMNDPRARYGNPNAGNQGSEGNANNETSNQESGDPSAELKGLLGI